MNAPRDDGLDPLETLAIGALVVFGVVSVGHWLAASLAALVGRRRSLDAGLAESFSALRQLPKRWSDPRRAWPEPAASNLPGPVLYWLSVAVVLATALGALLLWLKYRQRRHEPIDAVDVSASIRNQGWRRPGNSRRSSAESPRPAVWCSGDGADEC